MAQPSVLLRWATAVGALVTNPPSGKMDTGFEAPGGVPEKPALDYVNAKFKNIFEWLAYLKDLTSEALTWAGTQTFNNLVVTGTATLAALNAASLALSGALTVAGAATLNGASVVNGTLRAANSLWISTAKAIILEGTAKLVIASNPAVGTAILNEIHAKSVAKAWVFFHTDGAGGVVIDGGLNVSSVVLESGARFRVNFAQAMANANFGAHVTSSSSNESLGCTGKAVGSATFTIGQYVSVSGSGGAASTWTSPPSGGYLLSTANKYYQVCIFGEQ